MNILDIEKQRVEIFTTLFGYTQLLFACEDINYDAAVQAITDNGDVNQGNKNGETPLLLATRNAYKDESNAIKIITLLLDKGANINAHTHLTGETALMRAAYYGSFQVAKLLLSRGADINQRRLDGNTVLSSLDEASPSFLKRRKRIMKLLEEAGGVR